MSLRKVKSIASIPSIVALTIFITNCAGVKTLEVFTKD